MLLGMLKYVANVSDGQSAVFAWLKMMAKPGHGMKMPWFLL